MPGIPFEPFHHLEYLRRQAEIPSVQSQEVSVRTNSFNSSRLTAGNRPQRELGTPKAVLARNRSLAHAKAALPNSVMFEAGLALSLAFGAIAVVAFLVGAGITP